MGAFLGYLLIPFRDITSRARLAGAVVTVIANLLMAWDRLSVLPQKKYWFAFNLFAVGYHMALIEGYIGPSKKQEASRG